MPHKDYSIVWKQFHIGSRIAERLGAQSTICLPYFVDGADKVNFEKSTLTVLKEMHLLRGILVALNETAPTIDSAENKKYFPTVIQDLKGFFGFNSTEQLITDISSFIRKENGDKVSLIALLNGLEFEGKSSKIKFDCCIDLYNILERNEYDDRPKGIELLRKLTNEINPAEINQNFVPHLKTFSEFE